jgi:hypothetical protein
MCDLACLRSSFLLAPDQPFTSASAQNLFNADFEHVQNPLRRPAVGS